MSEARRIFQVGDHDNRTPLHIAAALGDQDTVRTLLWNKADINAIDRFEGYRWSAKLGYTFNHGVRTNYFTLALLYFGNYFGLKKELHSFFCHHQLSDLI